MLSVEVSRWQWYATVTVKLEINCDCLEQLEIGETEMIDLNRVSDAIPWHH